MHSYQLHLSSLDYLSFPLDYLRFSRLIIGISYSIFVISTTHFKITTMKTKLTLKNDFDLTFDVLETEEMNFINGGEEEVWVGVDPITGELILRVKPVRP